jgi:hypothetical protein
MTDHEKEAGSREEPPTLQGPAGPTGPDPQDLRVRRAVRRTAILWAVLAFVAWNVVFDRLIVLGGRQYIRDAVRLEAEGSYLFIDDAMKPAVTRAFWIATAVGSTVGAIGVIAVRRKRRWRLRDYFP